MRFFRNNSKEKIPLHRIEALTDGIFAIAMTLLVLGIDLPHKGDSSVQISLYQLVFGQFHEFFNYGLSFILLSNFWVIHHKQFNFIKRTDAGHLWINIITLMFITLVPFSTALAGDFPGESAAKLFFSTNMFFIAILLRWNWTYAAGDNRLIDSDMDPKRIILGTRKTLILPIVTFLAMIIALLHPVNSSYIYLLIPCLLFLPYFRRVTNYQKA